MRVFHAVDRFILLSSRPVDRRQFLRYTVALTGVGSMGSLIAACAETDDGEEATDEPVDEPVDDGESESLETDDDEVAAEPEDTEDDEVSTIMVNGEEVEVPDDFEPFETPELDLATLEVEIPDGTMEAQSWDNTWVGEVTDDLFIGIRVAEEYGDEPREVTVYLCDDVVSIILDGELEDDEATLSGDDAEVSLELVDNEITGTVTLTDGEPASFTAEPATDDAGVYVAQMDVEDGEIIGRWIVLEDGQQRGVTTCCLPVCFPCMPF